MIDGAVLLPQVRLQWKICEGEVEISPAAPTCMALRKRCFAQGWEPHHAPSSVVLCHSFFFSLYAKFFRFSGFAIMAASQLATFESAFARLRDAVKPHHVVEFQDTKLQDVWEAAKEIQRIQRQRRSLRNMGRLKPFLQGLEKYSKCIDTLCNGTPFLPWVWAPVVS